MKKLIFLLLMAVALVGFVSAGTAHPPGVLTLEVNYTEAALSEYGVDDHVVTPDTVLVMVMPITVELPSLQLVVVSYKTRPHNDIMNITGMSTELRQACTGFAAVDYYLRC